MASSSTSPAETPSDPTALEDQEMAALRARRSALDAREKALFDAKFPALLLGHHDQVWRALSKLGVRSPLLEDLVQDVFLTFYDGVIESGFPDSIPAKLQALAMGFARNHFRREEHNPVTLGPPSSSSEKPHSAPEIERTLDLAALASRLLPALTPEHREVVDAVYARDLSHEEAARELGISRTTFTTRLAAARRRLAELLIFLPPSQRRPR